MNYCIKIFYFYFLSHFYFRPSGIENFYQIKFEINPFPLSLKYKQNLN